MTDYESSDNQDLQGSELQNKQIQRLQKLWKQMKDSKKKLNLSNQTYKSPEKQKQEDFEEINYEKQKSSGKYRKVSNSQDFSQNGKLNKQLVQNLLEAQDEIDKCHEKIGKLVATNNYQKDQLSEIQERIQTLSSNQKEMLNQRKDSEKVEFTSQEFMAIIESQDIKLQSLVRENNNLLEENINLQRELNQQKKENERIKQKMDQIESNLDEVFLEKNSKGAQILEIEYLKSDIERLITLLRSTKEYKEFSNFSKDSDNLRFLKRMPNLIIENQKAKSIQFSIPHKGSFQIVEKLLWVPLDAYEHLINIREKYNNGISDECIEEILIGINNIWLQREQNTIQRIKKKNEQEIQNLKKLLNQHVSFSEVTTKRQNSRLKNQLYKALKEKENIEIEKNKQPKDQLLFITDAAKLNKNFEEKLEQKNKEIDNLNNLIFQLKSKNSHQDKVIYMDGALWILDKVQKEVLRHKENISILIVEFNKAVEQMFNNQNFNEQQFLNLYRIMIDGFDQQMENFHEKIILMQDSTKNKVVHISERKNSPNKF